MKLTTTLTARDKKLLYFLAIFLIFALGFWILIQPALDENLALEDQITLYDQQYQDAMLRVATLPNLEALHETITEQCELLREPYYPTMIHSEVDTVVTTLLTRHNLMSVRLAINSDTNPTLKPYVHSALAAELEESTSTSDTAPNFTRIISVSGTVWGDSADWIRFLDTIAEHYSGLRISFFQINTVQRNTGNGLSNTTEISYQLELYSVVGGIS